MKRLLAAAIFAAGLSACAATNDELLDDMNAVKDQWIKSVKRLDPLLYGVYPLSEEYQIGDVYAYRKPCPGSEKLPAGTLETVKLGTVPGMARELDRYYATRIRLPATSFETDKLDQRAPQGNARHVYRSAGFSDAMPITAFPSYTMATGNAWNFAASVPGKVFGAVFGAAGTEDTQVRLKVLSNSTFGLPAYESLQYLRGWCARTRRCEQTTISEVYQAVAPAAPHSCGFKVLMVNRLYVTRGIQHEYLYRNAQVAQAAVARLQALELYAGKADKLVQDTATKGAAGPAAGDQPIDADKKAAAARDEVLGALLKSVNEDVRSLAAKPAGGTFTFGTYGATGITFIENFPRPLAFAYGSVTLPEPGTLAPGVSGQRPPDLGPMMVASPANPLTSPPTIAAAGAAEPIASTTPATPMVEPPTITPTVKPRQETSCVRPSDPTDADDMAAYTACKVANGEQ